MLGAFGYARWLSSVIIRYFVADYYLLVAVMATSFGETKMTKVGFIGLGNVGGKLAGSLLRNKIDLTVRDL